MDVYQSFRSSTVNLFCLLYPWPMLIGSIAKEMLRIDSDFHKQAEHQGYI